MGLRNPTSPSGRKTLAANRVLVIDDDPLITKILEKGLRQLGYTVAVARHGADAAFLVLEFLPDLIFLDVMLPDVDGEEICKRIRSNAQAKDTPIISISALADTTKIDRMYAAGVNLFIPKPFVIADLGVKIEKLIGPIRFEKQSPWQGKRTPLIVSASALAIVLGVIAIFIFRHYSQEQIPAALKDLEAFSALFSERDRNGDGVVSRIECGNDADFKRFDSNHDDAITPLDAKVLLDELKKDKKGAITKARWIDWGGTSLSFVLLDGNADGELNAHDFIPTDTPRLETGDLFTGIDPRTGEELLLDARQKSWFDEHLELDQFSMVLWRDLAVRRSHILEAEYGDILNDEGTVLSRGFVRNMDGLWEVYGVDGVKRGIAQKDYRFEKRSNTPAPVWLAKYTRLNPNDSSGWAALALEMSGYQEMLPEAVHAAKRALVYNRKLSELYELANVKLVRGRLVNREQHESEDSQ